MKEVNKISVSVDLPRMKKYMEYSAAIYRMYLAYLSAEDIHGYSIDECFIYLVNPFMVQLM